MAHSSAEAPSEVQTQRPRNPDTTPRSAAERQQWEAFLTQLYTLRLQNSVYKFMPPEVAVAVQTFIDATPAERHKLVQHQSDMYNWTTLEKTTAAVGAAQVQQRLGGGVSTEKDAEVMRDYLAALRQLFASYYIPGGTYCHESKVFYETGFVWDSKAFERWNTQRWILPHIKPLLPFAAERNVACQRKDRFALASYAAVSWHILHCHINRFIFHDLIPGGSRGGGLGTEVALILPYIDELNANYILTREAAPLKFDVPDNPLLQMPYVMGTCSIALFTHLRAALAPFGPQYYVAVDDREEKQNAPNLVNVMIGADAKYYQWANPDLPDPFWHHLLNAVWSVPAEQQQQMRAFDPLIVHTPLPSLVYSSASKSHRRSSTHIKA